MAKKKKSATVQVEWFDRQYSGKEVFSRLWARTKGVRYLIFCGLLMGLLVGGAWMPILKSVQPLMLRAQLADNAPTPKSAEKTVNVDDTMSDAESISVGEEALKKQDQIQYYVHKAEGFVQKHTNLETRNADGSVALWLYFAMGMIVPLAFILKILGEYLNHYLLQKAGAKVVMNLRNDIFEHLQKQSLTFFSRIDIGRLMSRCNGDPVQVQSIISNTLADVCQAPFEIAIAVTFIILFALENEMFSILIFGIVAFPLLMFPIIMIGKQIRRWSKTIMERSANVSSNMHENLTCIRVVKAYHTEAVELDKCKDVNLKLMKSSLRSLRFSLAVSPVTHSVSVLVVTAFLVFCFLQGRTLADIVPLLPPLLIIYKPMKQLGKIQNSIEVARAALNRIYSILDVDTELKEPLDAISQPNFGNEIQFKNVNFRYTETGDMVVNNATFTIKCGQMVAVVGSTGSGKSTLANLLARFYDATSGEILIDGNDIKNIKIADLRQLIGVVTQETLLFNETIAANIMYGTENATMDEVVEAAKMANAHKFIMENPDGYQRIVGEKGFVLSGGERQRIAIARAILKNPPILILDEATSALDTVTEQLVQEALVKLMSNRTVFAIAHRLSTIRNADLILVMDKGQIIEHGTHEELYDKGGLYYRLCNIQNQQK